MRSGRLAPAVALALAVPLLAAATAPAQGAPSKGVTFISFEDVPQECNFINTTPLRGRYAAAKFKGPSAKDGGAVLDDCASFGVSPRTGDRFLAFNASADMSNGGKARGPETIKLPTRQKKVALWLSQGGGSADVTFKLTGKRNGKVIRRSSATTNTSDWTKLQIRNRKGFDQLKVVANPGQVFLLDDLTMWR